MSDVRCTLNIFQYLDAADVCLMMATVSYNRHTQSEGPAHETGHALECGEDC